MSKFEFLRDNFTKYGYKIFPVIENSKEPLIDKWQLDASSDTRQLVYWLENAKNCNFGLPAYANRLFIIDIDMHGDVNGLDSFNRLLNDLGLAPSDISTLQQTTPSGGIHLIFKSDDELDFVKNSSNSFDGYPGIDIRTKGYILIEPSIIDGRPYKLSGGVDKISNVPQLLKDYIIENNERQRVVTEQQRNEGYFVEGKIIDKGNRDDEIFSYIKYLYHSTTLNIKEISVLAHAYNQECFNPPLSDGVIDYKIKKLLEHERRGSILIRL